MSFLNEYESIPPSDVARRVGVVAGWIRTDTRAFFAELRERRPVFRTPAFTLVTRHHDVLHILSRPRQFSVRLYGTKMDDVVGPFMLGRDDAIENYRDKSLMRTVMPLEDLTKVRMLVQRAAKDVLPLTSQTFDVVKQLSRKIPLELCNRYFGFPGPDEESMLRWSKATQTDFFKNIVNDPVIHAAAVEAGNEMRTYINSLVAKASDQLCSPDTVVGRLLSLSNVGHSPFDHRALVANIAGLLVGSVETTSQAVVQSLREILLRPHVRDKAIELAESGPHSELDKIVWEALRFNPINPLLFRYCEESTVVGEGTSYSELISEGTVIFTCTSSAMWDEAVVDDADMFRTDRPSFSYLHFGYGSHECLGKQIGEVMIPEIIRILLLRAPKLLNGPEGEIDFEGGPFPESFKVRIDKPLEE